MCVYNVSYLCAKVLHACVGGVSLALEVEHGAEVAVCGVLSETSVSQGQGNVLCRLPVLGARMGIFP